MSKATSGPPRLGDFRRSDETRAQKIADRGIRELHFRNDKSLQETESVLEVIWNALHETLT